MSDDVERTHWVRIHQPFCIPKQWVCGPLDDLSFTENQDECGKYTLEECVLIHEQLHRDIPSAVIVTDAI